MSFRRRGFALGLLLICVSGPATFATDDCNTNGASDAVEVGLACDAVMGPTAAMSPLGDESGQDETPRLATDGNGYWVAVWNANPAGDHDIHVARSSDNGQTWSPPAPLNSTAAVDTGADIRPVVRYAGGQTWIAVWMSDDSGGGLGTDFDILYSLSEDAGLSWSPVAAVNQHATSDSANDLFPQMSVDANGLIVVVWASDVDLGGIGADRDVLFARSLDLGLSWTPATALNSNASLDSGLDNAPQIAAGADGAWVAVWTSNDDLGGAVGTDFDILVARSADDGATWTPPAAVTAYAATDTDLDEFPRFESDGQGVWMVVWRSLHDIGGTGSDADILGSVSVDNGASWSAPAPVNANAGVDSGSDTRPQIATDRAGNWVVGWDSLDTLAGTIGTDADVLLARSGDVGATWSGPILADAGATSDSGSDTNPCIVAGGDGTWFVSWSGERSAGNDQNILLAGFPLAPCGEPAVAASDCNTNGVPDECDLLDGSSVDANSDGVLDTCEAAVDCNTNNIPDEFENHTGTLRDCNTNGRDDACDIADGTLTDVDADELPDECDAPIDCNTNGVPDDMDMSGGTAGVGVYAAAPMAFIADLSTVSSTQTVGDSGPVIDVDVQVNITHTFDGDLELLLTHNGVTVFLASNVGGSGQNFDDTIFDDEAPFPITAGAAPFLGAYQPFPGFLGDFDGLDLAGNWTLDCTDQQPGDVGFLNFWTLYISTASAANGDCNSNGVPDECEAFDCNSNGVADFCEGAGDCNSNGLPDNCEPFDGYDCDSNGTPDVCETVADCNTNDQPDLCDLLQLLDGDCDTNGTPDQCDPDCNTNGLPDQCDDPGQDCNSDGIPDPCQMPLLDCNANSVPDECELAGQDCDTNGRLDACELGIDCNTNDVPDHCESGALPDCDTNGAFDECEDKDDCNTDGLPDGCDIAGGGADCDLNGVPDVCDVDCDANGVPDACDLSPSAADCDTNGVLDACELIDCDTNGALDICDLAGGANDCDLDGVPSACDNDCNTNGLADECESPDCNTNFIPDECEAADCNSNGLHDFCEIAGGMAGDADTDGVPDECDISGSSCATGICGDITGDALVDGDDVSAFVACLMDDFGPNCGCGDFDHSGQVDAPDVNMIVLGLLQGTQAACEGQAAPECAVDLDADSDNGNNAPDFGPNPATDDEDKIEDDAAKPGRIIRVNNDDDDNDGLRDDGDGFMIDGGPAGANQNAMEDDFVRITINIPAPTDLTVAKVKFTYDMSDPAKAKAADSLVTLHGGNLRLWTKNGDAARKSASPDAPMPGDFIKSGVAYTATALGLTNAQRMRDLFVEAVRPSAKFGAERVVVEVDPDGPGPMDFKCNDAIRLTALAIDVDMDSDNNNADGDPGRTETEDALEDRSGSTKHPGKMIPVNDDSDDDDIVRDFGDGYNLDGGIAGDKAADDRTNVEDDFAVLTLSIPAPIDLTQARLKITYDASNPGMATLIANKDVMPAAGQMRLWLKSGTSMRKPASAKAGTPGDWVEPGQYDDASKLGLTGGTREVRIYVEATAPSASIAADQIKVELDPDGAGPAGFLLSDAVRVTLIKFTYSADANQKYGYDAYRSPAASVVLPPYDFVSVRRGTTNNETTSNLAVAPFHADLVITLKSADEAVSKIAPAKVAATPQKLTHTARNFADKKKGVFVQPLLGGAMGMKGPRLRVEAYSLLEIAELHYYRIRDNRVRATTPAKNPTLADLLTKMNGVYKQGVIHVKELKGDRDKSIEYDVNRNGLLDVYIDGNDLEFKKISDAALDGDNKIAYVEKLRANWRLDAAAAAGQKQIRVKSIAVLTVGMTLRIGPASGAGEVIKITAINRGTKTITVMNNLAGRHGVDHTLYISLAGISTDPQMITDGGGELIQTLVHEMMHRDKFADGGSGLADLAENDNVMYYTTGLTGPGLLRYREQTVVDTGSGDPNGAKQKQWEKIKR